MKQFLLIHKGGILATCDNKKELNETFLLLTSKAIKDLIGDMNSMIIRELTYANDIIINAKQYYSLDQFNNRSINKWKN